MRTLLPPGRTLAPVFALLSTLACSTLLAQNISLPKLKGGPRSKPQPRRTPAARPPASRPRVPSRRPTARRPSPADLQTTARRAAAGRARTWLAREEKLLADIAQSQRDLPLAPPGAPPANAFVDPTGRAGMLHLYRVHLSLRRDDGQRPVGPALSPEMLKINVANQAPIVSPRPDGCQVDCLGTAPPALRLHLPPGWEYTENRAADRPLPLDWSQAVELEASEAELPPLPRVREIPTLAIGPEDVTAAREALQALQHGVPTAPQSEYPSPALHCQKALDFITLARDAIDKTAQDADTLSGNLATLSPDAIAAERRRLWRAFQQAQERLEVAEEQVGLGTRALESLQSVNAPGGKPGPRELLGAGYPPLHHQKLQDLLQLARVRLLQYRAVASWWQSQLQDPQHPDRRAALQLLDAARLGAGAGPERVAEFNAQAMAYQDAARGETENVPDAAAPGMTGQEGGRKRKVLLHTLMLPVSLNRSMVPLRVQRDELHVEDKCLLSKGVAAEAIPFTLDDQAGVWVAQVPRSALANDGRLIIRRSTPDSVLERSLSLVNVDPYEADQHTLALPAWNLYLFKKFEIRNGAEEPTSLLTELPPLPDGSNIGRLRETSLDKKVSVYGPDGSWWVGPSASGLSWRLRAAPKQAFSSANSSQRMRGWALVDAIRLESVEAGHIAGVRVESPEEKLLAILGPGTLTEEGRSYLNGGLLFRISNQRVTSIQIGASLGRLNDKPIPAIRPGTITRIDYDSGLLWVQKHPKLSMEKDARFELLRDGLPLFERDSLTGAPIWAVVVDTADDQLICRLYRKDDAGRRTDDCTAALRTVPNPASAMISVQALEK